MEYQLNHNLDSREYMVKATGEYGEKIFCMTMDLNSCVITYGLEKDEIWVIYIIPLEMNKKINFEKLGLI